MAQLLVRKVEDRLVHKLRARTLMEFLVSADGEVLPGVELELPRSREGAGRDTGL